MVFGGCPKCWDTPCTCGHEYKCWSIESLEEQIAMLENVLKKKKDDL